MKSLTMVLCWIKSQLFRLTLAQKIVFIFLMCQEMENSNAKRTDPPKKCFAILFKEIPKKKKNDSFQLLFLRFLVLPIYSWSINIIVLLWAHFLVMLCSYMISSSSMASDSINMQILPKLHSKSELFLELQTHIYNYILFGGRTTWNLWH